MLHIPIFKYLSQSPSSPLLSNCPEQYILLSFNNYFPWWIMGTKALAWSPTYVSWVLSFARHFTWSSPFSQYQVMLLQMLLKAAALHSQYHPKPPYRKVQVLPVDQLMTLTLVMQKFMESSQCFASYCDISATSQLPSISAPISRVYVTTGALNSSRRPFYFHPNDYNGWLWYFQCHLSNWPVIVSFDLLLQTC